MIGTMPQVDMFVSDGVNLQEQVRTDYFDRPGTGTLYQNQPGEKPERGAASQQGGAIPTPAAGTVLGATPEPTQGTVSTPPMAQPAKRAAPSKKGPQ